MTKTYQATVEIDLTDVEIQGIRDSGQSVPSALIDELEADLVKAGYPARVVQVNEKGTI